MWCLKVLFLLTSLLIECCAVLFDGMKASVSLRRVVTVSFTWKRFMRSWLERSVWSSSTPITGHYSPWVSNSCSFSLFSFFVTFRKKTRLTLSWGRQNRFTRADSRWKAQHQRIWLFRVWCDNLLKSQLTPMYCCCCCHRCPKSFVWDDWERGSHSCGYGQAINGKAVHTIP